MALRIPSNSGGRSRYSRRKPKVAICTTTSSRILGSSSPDNSCKRVAAVRCPLACVGRMSRPTASTKPATARNRSCLSRDRAARSSKERASGRPNSARRHARNTRRRSSFDSLAASINASNPPGTSIRASASAADSRIKVSTALVLTTRSASTAPVSRLNPTTSIAIHCPRTFGGRWISFTRPRLSVAWPAAFSSSSSSSQGACGPRWPGRSPKTHGIVMAWRTASRNTISFIGMRVDTPRQSGRQPWRTCALGAPHPPAFFMPLLLTHPMFMVPSGMSILFLIGRQRATPPRQEQPSPSRECQPPSSQGAHSPRRRPVSRDCHRSTRGDARSISAPFRG